MTIIQAAIGSVSMAGPAYPSIIKPVDGIPHSSPPVFFVPDEHLIVTLDANTLYKIRFGVYLATTAGVGSNHYLRLRPSSPLDFVSLMITGMSLGTSHGWTSPPADPTNSGTYNTETFNADAYNFNCGGVGNQIRLGYGRMKTGSSPVTIALWYGQASSNPGTHFVRRGSWLHATVDEDEVP